jgi:hypothetical protein
MKYEWIPLAGLLATIALSGYMTMQMRESRTAFEASPQSGVAVTCDSPAPARAGTTGCDNPLEPGEERR